VSPVYDVTPHILVVVTVIAAAAVVVVAVVAAAERVARGSITDCSDT
jgi:hypothetical protein